MKDKFILDVVSSSMEFLTVEQSRHLKLLLEKQLYNYELTPVCLALVPTNNIMERIIVFLASKKLDGLSSKTLINYKRQLVAFSNHYQKNIEEITSMDIRMYLASYGKDGQKQSTINTLISTLKSFFWWLENEEYITKSPMRKIKSIKTEKRVRKALTPEELELLRDSCRDIRDKALVEFFYSTGCRIDEVYKLNKGDIMWHNCSVMVIGKGNKERPVYLNASAKVHLWKYLQTRIDTTDALFVSERNPHGRLGMRAIQKIFNELGKTAGITKSVYPHLMRHTTATAMLRNGATITEVQHLLGHEDPATTMIYTDVDEQNIQMSHKKHLA